MIYDPRSNFVHPLQSNEWEKTRQEMGIETLRIKGLLMTLHKIPYTGFKIGYIPRSKVPNKSVLNKLFRYGKKNNVIFIKIEPYIEKSSKFKIQSSKLVKSPHPLFPSWTQILDLDKTEDELLKLFHPKTRYNIHLAEKKGVSVREESNDKGFAIFSKLYFETTKRQKYFGHDEKYHITVWKNLKNKFAHILIAYYQSFPLAAYQIWVKDDMAYYVYGGTSNKYRNLMASNLLMWESIKLAKKSGAKKFDMWGSLPPNYNSTTHPWSGFTRFKSGYGTKFVEFIGSFDLIINPFIYHLYNIFYYLREIYLKLRA